jgi:hypothetical protein
LIYSFNQLAGAESEKKEPLNEKPAYEENEIDSATMDMLFRDKGDK